MRYVPSDEMQKDAIPYEGLGEKSWVVIDGHLTGVVENYKPVKLGAALDIGCGSGFIARVLGRIFPRVYGVDLADYRRQDRKVDIHFDQVDLNFQALPYPDGMFDMVTAFQVIEHLENPFLIMREARRVLRPGGLFMISMPNPYNMIFRIKFLLTGTMPPWNALNNHLLFMTRDVFAKTYLSHFDVAEMFYQKGVMPFSGRMQWFLGKKKGKNKKILPRSEWFSSRIGYVLRKK